MPIVKKLFKHGGSYAVDVPMEFVKNTNGNEVILDVTSTDVHIHHKTGLDNIESEPHFATFISALATDAMKDPDKLRTAKEVWDDEWDNLLKGITVEGDE